MPLSQLSHAVSIAFGTASFFMEDHGRTVRVDIPTDVLARLAGIRMPVSRGDCIDQLLKHRRQSGRIAAHEYRFGGFMPEVNVLVVRIIANDLAQERDPRSGAESPV